MPTTCTAVGFSNNSAQTSPAQQRQHRAGEDASPLYTWVALTHTSLSPTPQPTPTPRSQRYTSCGWAETIGDVIPSRAARPRQNGVRVQAAIDWQRVIVLGADISVRI